MTSFTKDNVPAIHKEIDAALAVIAEKWGITNLTTGTLRYNSAEMRLSVTGKVVPVTATVVVATAINAGVSVMNMNAAQIWGLIGKTFISGGERYTITDIKNNRPKFPISAKNALGGQYKFTKSAVERGKTW